MSSAPTLGLGRRLSDLRSSGRRLLGPYLVAGFPSAAGFQELCAGMAEAGADLLEIGIPFSDPLMDGPVIQEASRLALEAEVRPHAALRAVATAKPTIPFIFMTYTNPVMQMGWAPFAEAATGAGASGVLLPDLPPEEAGPWIEAARQAGLDTVFMVAPTTPDDRLREAAGLTSGFVYCVSLLGVTGVRESLSQRARPLVQRVRSATDLPALLGIGVSTPVHAVEACSFADGAIVGSAIIKAVLEDGTDAAVALVRRMREELDGSVD